MVVGVVGGMVCYSVCVCVVLGRWRYVRGGDGDVEVLLLVVKGEGGTRKGAVR